MTAVQNYFICNGVLKPVDEFLDTMITGKTVVYEVIKAVGSKPVFLDEHIMRMHNSLLRAGIDFRADEQVRRSIQQLLEANPVERNNIRVALVFNQKSVPNYVVVYFIPSKYPSADEYKNGVCIETISAERNNPTAKIEDKSLRNRANDVMHRNGLFEVLLVNHEGKITEGSRSNIFFVKGNSIVTAPDSMVLGGITRDKVIAICKRSGYPVELRCATVDELKTFDAIFITGTSPCVLPVKSCNGIAYNAKYEVVANILHQYQAEEMK